MLENVHVLLGYNVYSGFVLLSLFICIFILGCFPPLTPPTPGLPHLSGPPCCSWLLEWQDFSFREFLPQRGIMPGTSSINCLCVSLMGKEEKKQRQVSRLCVYVSKTGDTVDVFYKNLLLWLKSGGNNKQHHPVWQMSLPEKYFRHRLITAAYRTIVM